MIKDVIELRRYIVKIYGIVQGVGFRPFVFKNSKKYNIKGYIKNLGSYVEMDIEGGKNNIKEFLLNIANDPPHLARIEKIVVEKLDLLGYCDFKIKNSSEDINNLKFISSDIATCENCLREIDNPKSRYYNYPFINCTECGPRYTIIKDLPYDRKNTTMDKFKMCKSCNDEYKDILSRRFHAQPTSCNKCGPSLILTDNKGKRIITSNILKRVVDYIKKGKIIGIKGIGGFHLCCDPFNEKTINILRSRKNRPYKPFAIMAKDIEKAKLISKINKNEEELLKSNKRPIVLLEKNLDYPLSDKVSPNNKYIGIMLPYTPLHHLIFSEGIDYLIMTSGNISNSPIKYKNNEALEDLRDIADYFLFNNRDINIPIDDSVTRMINNEEIVIRLARGYAPFSIKIEGNNDVLALGGDLKGSFSFSQKGYGFMSQYIGDLGNYDTFITYEIVLNNIISLFNLKPVAIAYDLHPGYFSSKYGEKLKGLKIKIQHHHAHMVSAMGEHDIYNETIGIIYDGSGMGTDGCIWGGEFFLGNRKDFKRLGHLRYTNIQGGDRAIKEPFRVALSYLYELGIDFTNIINQNSEELDLIKQALTYDLNTFITSSMGRFFDLVSYLLGVCDVVTYEGQGAIELENILNPSIKEVYEYSFINENNAFQIDYGDIILGILEDIKLDVDPSIISVKFHNTVGKFTVDGAVIIRDKYETNDVVLSGGVFQNKYLLEITYKELVNRGFNVYYNKKIPINDNGISFGQMIIANSRLEER